MCGILGSYKKYIDDKTFANALELLSHRGPDGYGIWKDDQGCCSLGHRRLSIIDLSDKGKQPMLSSSGRYVITYNGEIYNYLEVRDELISHGYAFHSESDTEVFVNAYELWGVDSFNKFNGMWAAAIYDTKNKELILCRDRFGVKPLFYCNKCTNGGVLFASEMKGLIPLMDKVTPNGRLLNDPAYFMFRYEYTDECLIEEISRVNAGHYMVFSDSGTKDVRYWNTLDNLVDVPQSYEEQCMRFRDLFLDSCKIRMRSDVSLGTALSGGLDSSATICTMAKLASDDIKTINKDFQHAYIASFPGSDLDETKYAHCVTDYLNISKSDIVIDPVKGIEELDDQLYMFEEIYNTSPVPMVQTYRALRRDGVLVTLDGHGADELLGGYNYTVSSALLDVGPFSRDLINLVDTTDGMSNADIHRSFADYQKIYWNYRLKHAARIILGRADNDKIYDKDNIKQLKKLSHMNRTLYNAFHVITLPTLLRNYDRYSMMNGVEIRMPFMDYRLVSYCFSLDHRAKTKNGYSKSIIRDSLKDILPNLIVERKNKIGFNTPIHEWMRGPWKEWLMDMVESSEFINSDYGGTQLKQKIEMAVKNDAMSFYDSGELWKKLSPYLWEKCFYKRAISNK